jgi:predicted 3-demethylubiquinone-9 3-methyltransferase (glyoxalase superfamily)
VHFESFSGITPFLWFDNQADDAVNFYILRIKNSRRLEVVPNNGSLAGTPARSDQETERNAGHAKDEEIGYCGTRARSRKLKKFSA